MNKFLLLLIFLPILLKAQVTTNQRSDTIDILHYNVMLNITDFASDTIRGGTAIRYTPRINNVTVLPLDLLHMVIDSVTTATTKLTSIYDDTLLHVMLPTAMNSGDTASLTVWYHGKPQVDPSGWGGFYFSGTSFAYNLGVGFETNPHNFGRAWYPCFDNFVERATYTFVIGTNNNKVSYCNGLLGADTADVHGVRWRTWNLAQTIPSYLASVNIAAYTQLNMTHNGIYGTIPITLSALPSDTSKLRKSFLHLNDAIACFEYHFGPYKWPKVGYSLIPFSSGAMEHASNISYPAYAANGLLTYEGLMAHELSHHWFGNLVTCHTAEDVWLNEGWASYCESLFTEWIYGKKAYDNSVLANHDEVVHFTHLIDGNYYPVSGVPHEYTYGNTVYMKGADVAHTLRGYMGDSLFEVGLLYFMQQHSYKDASSVNLRDDLITATGLTNLIDFFNDWVFNPGFPQFSIDSVTRISNGLNYDVTVYIKQKLRGATTYYTNVPIEISSFDTNWNRTIKHVLVSGQFSNFTFTLPFDPVMTTLDLDNKISDAITDEAQTIKATGGYNFTMARCSLIVKTITDSTFIRIEHNWVAPDAIKNNVSHYRISSLRYWNIDGMFPSSFNATARFYYDGRTNLTSGLTNWLDNDLTIPNGDSIILLYRQNASDDWHEWAHYTKSKIGTASTSKYGYVVADSLKRGQYTFANGVAGLVSSVNELPEPEPEVFAYPNPVKNNLTIEWIGASPSYPVTVNVFDSNGKLIQSSLVNDERLKLETTQLPGGIYTVQVIQKEKPLGKKQVVILN